MQLHQLAALRHSAVSRELKVLDLIFVALTIVFFLIALAYVRGCEKLQ